MKRLGVRKVEFTIEEDSMIIELNKPYITDEKKQSLNNKLKKRSRSSIQRRYLEVLKDLSLEDKRLLREVSSSYPFLIGRMDRQNNMIKYFFNPFWTSMKDRKYEIEELLESIRNEPVTFVRSHWPQKLDSYQPENNDKESKKRRKDIQDINRPRKKLKIQSDKSSSQPMPSYPDQSNITHTSPYNYLEYQLDELPSRASSSKRSLSRKSSFEKNFKSNQKISIFLENELTLPIPTNQNLRSANQSLADSIPSSASSSTHSLIPISRSINSHKNPKKLKMMKNQKQQEPSAKRSKMVLVDLSRAELLK